MKTTTLMMTQSFAVLCALTLFPACAKKKEEKKAEAAIVIPTLTGDYASACVPSAGISSLQALRFAKDPAGSGADMMMRTIEEYAGNACTLKLSTQRAYFKFTMGAAKNATLFEINFDETELTLTPETAEVAANWNRSFRCGISNWNVGQERAIDKSSGCVFGDNENRRKVLSIVKVEADKLQLGAPADATRENGKTPETRYSALESTVFTKRVIAPVDPNNPTPVAGCPDLSGAYVCSNGDALFAGKNVNIANVLGVAPKLVIKMGIPQPGNRPLLEKSYIPNEPERTEEDRGMTLVTRDQCELIGNVGKLRSLEKLSRTGETRKRFDTERVFELGEINGRKTLQISTSTRDVVDGNAGPEDKQRTECIKL